MNPNSTESPANNISRKNKLQEDRRNAAWDITNAPKNYISLLLTQGGGAFFAFASVWFIGRNLGSEGYGAIIAVVAGSQVIQVLLNWSVWSVSRYGVEEFLESGKIARIFWVRFFVLSINLILVLAFSSFWFPYVSDWLKLRPDSFGLVVLHLITVSFWLHVQMALQGAKMLRLNGFMQMLERLSTFLAIFALWWFGHLTVFSATLCYATVPALMLMIGIYQLRELIFSKFSISRNFIRELLQYSIPLFPHSLVGYLLSGYVDAIFIAKFLSTQELGVYSIATQMTGITLQIPTLVNMLLLSLFVSLQSEKNFHKIKDIFQNILPTLTFFWGAFCTLISFGGYFLIPLIFGEEFKFAVAPLWILMTASALHFPILLGYSALANATSRTYISTFSAIAAAFTNISLNFLLIPRFGTIGCAWSTVATSFIGTFVFALFFKLKDKIPFSWTFYATLPIISGAICLTITDNAIMSFTVFSILWCFIFVSKFASIKAALTLATKYVKRR